MTDQPQPTPTTLADMREELTELEFQAGQRQLTPEEERRLGTLQQQREQLRASAKNSYERKKSGDDIEMNQDDSPV
ncbi:MAG TPA: hypothetical protein VH186_38945 [Chloroflexia bacterium]|nr:hypothetical protein [Chloroflexia bacterium]